MKFYLVTGLSGAGKSQAINTLEDCGFYCVDNVPAALLYSFVSLVKSTVPDERSIAIVTDSRSGISSAEFLQATERMKADGIEHSVIFLDASSEVLQRRFKETRRKHPLIDEAGGRLPLAIEMDRVNLNEIKQSADYVIDTTDVTVASLRHRLVSTFGGGENRAMQVVSMSFGTKHGSVGYADLVFDVRCLPNPFYVEELKYRTGLEQCVSDYVFGSAEGMELRERLCGLLDFLLPLYEREGKTQVVIAFCCTGGQHRSVAFAEEIGRHVASLGYSVVTDHRDVGSKSEK